MFEASHQMRSATAGASLPIGIAPAAACDPGTSFFAGLVDHIVLVVRADQQSTAAVEHFVLRLGLNARKVRGAVLTGAGPA